MKKLLPLLIVLSAMLTASAATIIQSTVTVTNATTNGMTITVDGDVRTWTNSVFVASTQILTNSTVNGAAGNLVQHVVNYPFTGVSAYLVSGTVIRFRSALDAPSLTVTLSAGWGTVATITNTYTSAIAVRIPYTVESLAQRTNVASGVAAAINSNDNTNGINAAKLYGSITNNAATATTATYVTTSPLTNSISGNAATASAATNATYVTTSPLTNSISGNAETSTYVTTSPLTNNISGNAATATTAQTASNIVYTASTFASATNSITLNNTYWNYVATGDCSITSVVTTVTSPCWAAIAVTNSTGGDITFRITANTVRAIGTATTNSLVIPASKVGIASLAMFAPGITNYATAVEQ